MIRDWQLKVYPTNQKLSAADILKLFETELQTHEAVDIIIEFLERRSGAKEIVEKWIKTGRE